MPLLVCATPIGNLDDVTLRVLAALRDADVVLCEDTRHTRILLDRHGIRARALLSLHRLNEAKRVAEVVERLQAGETVALVSDAGTPGVADPGGRLVAAAVAAGLDVVVLPGASAVSTALVASGLLGDGPYRFLGWLPRKEQERAALWSELDAVRDPVVAFESPRRVVGSLRSLAAHDPERPVGVCRELTKLHETILRGPVTDVIAELDDPPRGEITLVIGPAVGQAEDGGEAAGAVRELVEAGTPRRVAAAVVSRLTGVSRNRLYRDDL
jgi:16S rRNA (cytidine1402-2'-O)-methyltransferase